MKNSKFLHFMNHIKTGQMKIVGNELVEGEPDQATDKNLDESK